MRDDGDDEKRPKLMWILVNLGNLGNFRDGAAERPKSRSGHPRGGSAERGNEKKIAKSRVFPKLPGFIYLRTLADSCGQLWMGGLSACRTIARRLTIITCRRHVGAADSADSCLPPCF